MEKIIKRTISLTTKKRDSRNKLFEEFYSHDKNTATFEFTVDGGVPTEEIVVLFHFKRTNRHLEVRGRVDKDKIIVNFDTSLIIKDEQVAGYIYYENGEKSNDVYRFMFDVHVSEIDKEHDLPVMEQESKRIVPLTDIVTKSEITELLKKIVANEKLYDDTEIKQQIESKADKEAVQAISSKVEALEQKADNDTIYNDAEIRGQIATKADTQLVEAIAQRVQTLENKTDNDTVYNDTELRQAVEEKADKQALLQYLPKSELTPISDKVQSIETNIGRMATQQQLESYVSKNELEQKGYLTSEDTHNFALKSEIPVATNLDAINEKIKTLEEKQPVDLSHLATKQEIEDSHYLTREDITGLATNSKVEAVESRVQQLENKPPVDLSNLATKQEIEDVVKTTELTKVTERVQSLEARPQIDASTLVTKDELEAKGYLKTAPDLSEYAKKSEIPSQFDSKPLTDRIESLETKAISNGSYNDKPLLDKIHEVQESLKGFITQSSRYLTEHQSLAHLVTKDELARMGYINAHQSLEHLVTKEELENKHYLTNQDVSNLATNSKVESVESRVQTLENKPPVDLSNLATKQELEAVRNSQPKVDTSNLVTKQELEDKHYVQDVSNLATTEKVTAVENRVQALENKSTTGNSVDVTKLITKDELKEKEDAIYESIARNPLYTTYTEDTLTEHLKGEDNIAVNNVDVRGGTIYSNASHTTADIFKGDVNKEKFVTFQTAMFTIANSIPDNYDVSKLTYAGNENNKVIFLSNKNFAEVVPKEQLKAIINEAGGTDYAKKSEVAELVTKEELASKGYIHDVSGLATKQELEAAKASIPQPYNDTEIRGQLAHKVDTDTLATLATKQELQTNDEEIRRRLTTLEGKTDNFITGVSVNKEGSNVTLTYNYVDGQTKNVSFTDSDTVNVAYDDSGLKQRITNLENRPQVEAYNDADIKQRLTALENNHVTKEQLHEATELDETQFVSPDELEAKHYLTATQAESVYAKKSELYNDSALASRVSALESKQDNDTVYNDTEIKQRLTNLENRPQVDLTDYAKKSEIPQAYNDSELSRRVSVLETKEDKDTIYNDEEIKRRLTTLEAKPTVDVSDFAKKTEVPTVDSVNNLLRTQGEQATKISALESKSAYEIHGTGMPNGKVSAPIGTTYVDMNVTNGALKWIKRSGTGNIGWQVFTGDTGWRTLPLLNKRGNARLQVRRINDQVIVKFDGLSWGWFGVDDVSKQEQQANISDKTIGGKKYTWIRLNVGRGNFVLPEGFRSASSLLSGLYGDLGDLLGSVYVGGIADSDALQLRYAMERKALTSNILSQIRISPITFITDDEWPTTLP